MKDMTMVSSNMNNTTIAKYLIFKTQFTKNGKTINKKYVLIGSSNRLNEAKKIFNKAKNDTENLGIFQVQITELWRDTTLIAVDERRNKSLRIR